MYETFWLFLVSVSLLAGCSTDIALSNTGRDARLQNAYELIGEDLMQESRNLLANYLLLEDYQERPKTLLKKLHAIGQRDPRKMLRPYRMAEILGSPPDYSAAIRQGMK